MKVEGAVAANVNPSVRSIPGTRNVASGLLLAMPKHEDETHRPAHVGPASRREVTHRHQRTKRKTHSAPRVSWNPASRQANSRVGSGTAARSVVIPMLRLPAYENRVALTAAPASGPKP